jgi:anti-anti-sigma regulatory factor
MAHPVEDDATPLYNARIAEWNKEAHIDLGCRIHLARVGDTLVLSIVGAAERNGYQFLAEKAIEIINSERKKALIVDLSLCERLSSSPLGMLGMMIMAFENRGGQVFVITGDPQIRKSLKILGLAERCRIIDDVAGIEIA